jgi:hypothetical protein
MNEEINVQEEGNDGEEEMEDDDEESEVDDDQDDEKVDVRMSFECQMSDKDDGRGGWKGRWRRRRTSKRGARTRPKVAMEVTVQERSVKAAWPRSQS